MTLGLPSRAAFLLAFLAWPVSLPAAEMESLGPAGEVVLSSREMSDVLKGRVVLKEIPCPGKKGKDFAAVGELSGSLDEAFAVVTDYRNYPRFMPHVRKVAVRDESHASSVVEITLDLPLGKVKRYRLKYAAERGDDGFLVSWEKLPWPELTPGKTVADTSGFWWVKRTEDGNLLAVYRVYSDPGRVPLGLTGLAAALSKGSIPDVIRKTRERIQALSGPRGR